MLDQKASSDVDYMPQPDFSLRALISVKKAKLTEQYPETMQKVAKGELKGEVAKVQIDNQIQTKKQQQAQKEQMDLFLSGYAIKTNHVKTLKRLRHPTQKQSTDRFTTPKANKF